jgi:hypothetical protein
MFTALCRIFVIGRIFGSIFLPNIRFWPKQENPFSVDHYREDSEIDVPRAYRAAPQAAAWAPADAALYSPSSTSCRPALGTAAAAATARAREEISIHSIEHCI